MIHIRGLLIDHETRCQHYHTERDIIAIKFKCCDTFYPCYECHEHDANHSAQRWSINERDEKVILCGACRHVLTIEEYMTCEAQCPSCTAPFNPRCANHYHLYFEISE